MVYCLTWHGMEGKLKYELNIYCSLFVLKLTLTDLWKSKLEIIWIMSITFSCWKLFSNFYFKHWVGSLAIIGWVRQTNQIYWTSQNFSLLRRQKLAHHQHLHWGGADEVKVPIKLMCLTLYLGWQKWMNFKNKLN